MRAYYCNLKALKSLKIGKSDSLTWLGLYIPSFGLYFSSDIINIWPLDCLVETEVLVWLKPFELLTFVLDLTLVFFGYVFSVDFALLILS